MKQFWKIAAITACLLATAPSGAGEAPLAEALEPYRAYLGTWEGNLSDDPDQPMLDVARWERALNGNAIRTLHSINDGMYGGESLIFWDKEKESLVFYYFTTADFFTTGTMHTEGEKIIALEKVSGGAEGVTEVKSEITMAEDSITVSTSMLKNGEWSEAVPRTYRRSDKEVKFK